ncbi:pyridoxal phosphate-dependent transferase [Paraphoma chrysanthemicola]|uniref:Pyridoxal phosphate-dependent transferase n=1 Tax=Paraphoma chrysanthemicola TaxID=798071 RepID=A0A8K0R5W7_9PLEO|nr:pyridoxal phosphate-dependent transferase [Paraphoma chrysanthemicola]
MLSTRGQSNADQLDIPWRFAQGTTFDAETNPNGIISFATAENALVQKELEDFASKVHIPGAGFRYAYCTSGGPRLPTAFATHINEYFNPFHRISGTDVKVTAAATALHDILAYSLCAPGEAILTSKPYYGRFEIDFGNKAGVRLVAAETDHESCFAEEVVRGFEEMVQECMREGGRVRAVLIVNPHNPLGRCYPKRTLIALLHFCAKHNIHLISDEIYALSVFPNSAYPDATPFTSVLSIDLNGIIDPNLVHVTYGLSKDFGSAGLKVGALVSRNEDLKKAVHAVVRFHGTSGPSVAIATAMLEDREWCRGFIELSRKRIAEAYQLATALLDGLGIEYFAGGNAGFFLWINLEKYLPPAKDERSGFERECALAEKFVEGGVFLHPGEEHGRVGWFRVVFTMEQGVVEAGLRRLGKVLRGLEW